MCHEIAPGHLRICGAVVGEATTGFPRRRESCPRSVHRNASQRRPGAGSARDEFIVKDDGVVQEVKYLWQELDLPLTSVMVTEICAQSAFMKKYTEIMLQFLDRVLFKNDQAAIVSVAGQAWLVTDLTDSLEKLRSGAENIGRPGPVLGSPCSVCIQSTSAASKAFPVASRLVECGILLGQAGSPATDGAQGDAASHRRSGHGQRPRSERSDRSLSERQCDDLFDSIPLSARGQDLLQARSPTSCPAASANEWPWRARW